MPTPTLLISKFCPNGTINQDKITGTNTKTGPAVKSIESAFSGMISSFTSNLSPSAMG